MNTVYQKIYQMYTKDCNCPGLVMKIDKYQRMQQKSVVSTFVSPLLLAVNRKPTRLGKGTRRR